MASGRPGLTIHSSGRRSIAHVLSNVAAPAPLNSGVSCHQFSHALFDQNLCTDRVARSLGDRLLVRLHLAPQTSDFVETRASVHIVNSAPPSARWARHSHVHSSLVWQLTVQSRRSSPSLARLISGVRSHKSL